MPGARRKLTSSLIGLSTMALAGGGLVYATTGADAATPDQGTVDTTSPSTTWTGGPFVVPNATGTGLDAPDCTAPMSCDDYLLHVRTPDGYGKDHQLEIKVGWTNPAADFDVYLLDKAGATVATAASSADPEAIITAPSAGDFTVRVVPYAPLGESYTASAKLVKTPANPAPGTATPPGFKNYAAPSGLPDAGNAGEPSIGNNFKTGSTMYQSYLSTYKVRFDGSTPAKATWTDVSANATKGCPQGSTQSLDPILFTDSKTGRTFESQLSGMDSLTCFTDDDGKTWSPSQGGGIPSGVDHQSIGGGPFAPGGPGTLPTTDYKHNVYYCSQDIAAAFCASSNDGGMTFGAGVPTYTMQQCGGLHGHLKVAPDGTAYLPNKGCGSKAAAVVSEDNGQSWDVRKVPTSSVGESDPSVGVGRNGTVYFGYTGADGKPGVATSTDKGKTWKYGQTVGTEFGIKNSVFPTLIAGDDNRAAFAYLGTPTGGNSQATGVFKGVWHLYVSTTYDGGRTWVTSDATPNDPVQRGSICTGGTTCGDDRNLLDFMDVTTDKQGHIIVGYADGCIGACVGNAKDTSHSAYATIARQSSGKPLVSSTNVKLSHFRVHRHSGYFAAKVTATNTGTRKVSGLQTSVHDNGRLIRLTKATSLAAGAQHTVTIRWKIVKSQRTHRIGAAIDPKQRIKEGNERDNRRVRTIHLG